MALLTLVQQNASLNLFYRDHRCINLEGVTRSCYFECLGFSMDARLREGINLFNQGRFFEAHENWEMLYQSAEINDKPFLEGLIQLSAACRLIDDFGEIRGPVKLIYQALIRFENYQPTYLDVKVADLAVAMESWAKELEAGGVRGRKPVPTIAVRRFGFL